VLLRNVRAHFESAYEFADNLDRAQQQSTVAPFSTYHWSSRRQWWSPTFKETFFGLLSLQSTLNGDPSKELPTEGHCTVPCFFCVSSTPRNR